MVPVEPQELQSELRQILDVNLNDERAAWEMQSDGSYKQKTSRKKEPLSCQDHLMELAKKREKEAKAAMKLKPLRPTVRSNKNIDR